MLSYLAIGFLFTIYKKVISLLFYLICLDAIWKLDEVTAYEDDVSHHLLSHQVFLLTHCSLRELVTLSYFL